MKKPPLRFHSDTTYSDYEMDMDKLIAGNSNWNLRSKVRLLFSLKISRLSKFFNFIINKVMFSTENTFSNGLLVILLLENRLTPNFKFCDVYDVKFQSLRQISLFFTTLCFNLAFENLRQKRLCGAIIEPPLNHHNISESVKIY